MKGMVGKLRGWGMIGVLIATLFLGVGAASAPPWPRRTSWRRPRSANREAPSKGGLK